MLSCFEPQFSKDNSDDASYVLQLDVDIVKYKNGLVQSSRDAIERAKLVSFVNYSFLILSDQVLTVLLCMQEKSTKGCCIDRSKTTIIIIYVFAIFFFFLCVRGFSAIDFYAYFLLVAETLYTNCAELDKGKMKMKICTRFFSK